MMMMQPGRSNSALYLSSDIEEDRRNRQERENAAQQALDAVGNLLKSADNALENLEKNDMLGSAIVRSCQELADALGGLANQLDQQSDDERRALVQAYLQDANDLQLLQDSSLSSSSMLQLVEQESTIEPMSEDDMMQALSGATSLLKDVAAEFRTISQDDADEIADVALTLARMFLMSLQDMLSTISPHDLIAGAYPQQQQYLGLSGGIEVLDDDDDDDVEAQFDIAMDEPVPRKKYTKGRVRVLWPRLGPAVQQAGQWGKDEVEKRPLLAVALGLTLWPMAVGTALVVTPLVLADGLLQDTYENCKDSPLVETLERGIAQLYQAGRLSFLCGGLMCRQTVRVASKQIERRGGVGKVAQEAVDIALYRALHPVETIGMVWDGVSWGFSAIRDVVATVQDAVEQQTDRTTAASLQ